MGGPVLDTDTGSLAAPPHLSISHELCFVVAVVFGVSPQNLLGYELLVERLQTNPKIVAHPGGLFAYNVRCVWGTIFVPPRSRHALHCTALHCTVCQPVHKLSNKADLLSLVSRVSAQNRRAWTHGCACRRWLPC